MIPRIKNAPRDDYGIHHIEPTRDLVGTKACGDVNLHSKPRPVRHGRIGGTWMAVWFDNLVGGLKHLEKC